MRVCLVAEFYSIGLNWTKPSITFWRSWWQSGCVKRWDDGKIAGLWWTNKRVCVCVCVWSLVVSATGEEQFGRVAKISHRVPTAADQQNFMIFSRFSKLFSRNLLSLCEVPLGRSTMWKCSIWQGGWNVPCPRWTPSAWNTPPSSVEKTRKTRKNRQHYQQGTSHFLSLWVMCTIFPK